MFDAIRTRINATTVVAVLALVFAMTGGAYAAKKYLITSTKQISPSVLKALQGKAGAAGSAGAAGAPGVQGAQGPQGSQGPAGAKGDKGERGEKGAKGDTGATGQTGFTETLPVGKTETGSWAMGRSSSNTYAAISFAIPLAEKLEQAEVHFIRSSNGKEIVFNFNSEESEELAQTACKGTAAEPKAVSGNLCIYAADISGAALFGSNFVYDPSIETETGLAGSAGTAGARIMGFAAGGEVLGWGSWAVTG